MKLLGSFLIVVLATATSLLPSVHAQECEEACLSCKTRKGCGTPAPEGHVQLPAIDEACIVAEGLASFVDYALTPCYCRGGIAACDPYDETKKISCGTGVVISKDCPAGQKCMGAGKCVDFNAGETGGEGSGTGGEGSGTGGEGSGTGGEGTGTGGEGSGSKDEGKKPPTCSADNANTRYPHEIDCKKYYNCRLISLVTYGYVESTCPGNYVFNKATTYCDEPENVPDCVQVSDC